MAVNGILLNQISGAKTDLSNVTSISSEGITVLKNSGLVTKTDAQNTLSNKSTGWIYNNSLKITQTRGEKPSSSYTEITSDKTYNVIAKDDGLTTDYYSVENTSKNNYGFIYNNYDGYYINTNAMVNSSYALAKVTITLSKATTLSVKYYHNSQNYFSASVGIIGEVDSTLTESSTADSSYLATTSRSSGTTLNSSVSLGTLSAGTHYFYVKYTHNRYSAAQDRFGFKIIDSSGNDFSRKENFNLPQKVNLEASTSTTISSNSSSYTTTLFSNVTAQKSYYIPSLRLFYHYKRQNGTSSSIKNMDNNSVSIVSGTTYEAWQLN